ncbi:hypothetical protein ACS5NO_32335 [Larkinella sp. GY13]|uniref:hypothetical protein n=1 Tax=Larkinella sp. GY13 TaxID=3453720 RepID=UPI003EEB1D19
MKYYNNNLVYAYRLFLMICTVLVAVGGVVTLYIVVSNYRSYQKNMQRTYVYSTNGAAVEVNSKQKK